MKYFKYHDEWSEIENATTYVEEEDGSEIRRITYKPMVQTLFEHVTAPKSTKQRLKREFRNTHFVRTCGWMQAMK